MGRAAQRLVAAGQRLLPRIAARRLLLRGSADTEAGLQAQRGRGPARGRNDGGRAEATLAAQPLGAKIVYAPAKAGRPPGVVVRQYPRARRAFRARRRHARGLEGASTGCFRTSSARASRTRSAKLYASSSSFARRRPRDARARFFARAESPVSPSPRAPGQARGRGRLTNVEPASENRHGWSTARVIPTRAMRRRRPALGATSSNGGLSRARPLCSPVMPSAW